jgi:Protein of unknown function (DUF1761)
MNPANVNWLAVLVSTISSFIIGAIWYSRVLFGKVWAKSNNLTDEQIRAGNKAKIFGVSFLCIFFAAVNLGFFLADPSINAMTGTFYGFLTGFGWVLPAFGVVAMFELKSWTWILINGFYWVVSFTVMGLIFGVWK